MCNTLFEGQRVETWWKHGSLQVGPSKKKSDLKYLLQPLGVVLHGALQTLQLPVLPRGLILAGRPFRRLTRLGHGVPLVGVGDLEVIRGTTVLHLGEDEGEAAVAVLDVVLLALQGQSDGQQAGQVCEGEGQWAAHGRERGRRCFSTWKNRQVETSKFLLWFITLAG